MTIYRAENVGSLQRPRYLMDAIKQRQAAMFAIPEMKRAEGNAPAKAAVLSTAEFKRIEDRAVDEAIAVQEEVGLDVVTDGEQRRLHFRDWLVKAVEGLSPIKAPPGLLQGMPGHADVERSDPYTVTGKIRLKHSVATEEFVYARARTKKPIKITVPHPFTYQLMYGPESKQVYPDPFELFHDAALLIRQECNELAQLGCEYIQIDAPVLTLPLDPNAGERMKSLGVSPERFLEEGVKIMDLIADIPGVQFAVHFCRGNAPTHYFSSGAYDRSAKVLFQTSKKVDTYLLEYDDWRAGSFEALKYVPHDKVVVLGLVSSMKNPQIETVQDLITRVEEAAQYFPKQQMALSAQCGFCSMVGVEGFDVSIQKAKLAQVVAAARRIWG
jgi:5-methyltetrahydropteroyltriglutamate--homocysteine methyltransferase